MPSSNKLEHIFSVPEDEFKDLKKEILEEFSTRERQIQAAIKEFPQNLMGLEIGKAYSMEQLAVHIFDLRLEEGLQKLLDECTTWGEQTPSGRVLLSKTIPKFGTITSASAIQDATALTEEEAPPVAPPTEQEKPEKAEAKSKKKRQSRNFREGEAEGRYPGLNLYESDLLDYLKQNFPDLEFTLPAINFEEKRVRDHQHMFQHLAYLAALGYVRKDPIRDNKYYYKLNKFD